MSQSTGPTTGHERASFVPDPLREYVPAIDQMREIGAFLHARGWSVGTSSNYSVVIQRDPLELVITASGMDKGQLRRSDFVRVDGQGQPVVGGQPKSSAETLLHTLIADCLPDVGAILHTHSVWATILSDHYFPQRGLTISGYEMLKGLAGITTHEHQQWVEIFENSQDIAALAAEIRPRILDSKQPLTHGFLLRRHGLYTWGKDLAEARRHIEIYEFLFEVVARKLR